MSTVKKNLKKIKANEPAIIKEFKEFINRGNVVDLAVGVIVGGADLQNAAFGALRSQGRRKRKFRTACIRGGKLAALDDLRTVLPLGFDG